jgi:hypothetical protein
MTARPYAVMATPSASCLTYEPFLTRASMETLGWAFLADFPGYFPAAERAVAFEALPAVERWWACVWQARARGDA